MIVVTGATGHLGRLVVEALLKRVPAASVGVSVRDPSKAADLLARGVRVRRGDFADADSLRDAFGDAAIVMIVSSNARASGGDPLAQHRNAIDAAVAAGARRIVYTSHMAASAGSAFPPVRDHAVTEAMLAESGVEWTSLRHGFYADSGLMLMGEGLTSGVLAAPADGKVSWTAHADLAEADAIILADALAGTGERYDGPTPPLTGPEALDLDDVAAVATTMLGRPVRREVVSDDDVRARIAARGAPPYASTMVVGLYAASRAGEFAAVDPTLERIIGRGPVPFRDLIATKFRA